MEGEQAQQPTPTQQPISDARQEQPKPKKSPRILTVLLVIITILSLCLTGYLAYHNYQLKNEIAQYRSDQIDTEISDQDLIDEESDSITKQEKDVEYMETASNDLVDLKSILNDIYAGKMEFEEKRDAVEYIDLSGKTYNIIVYNYIPGNSKYDDGYEGTSWTRDLDKEVAVFNQLSPGIQKAIFYHTAMGTETESRVEFKKIGSRNYVLEDGYFLPSGSLIRYYHTFDEVNSQIIYIRLDRYSDRSDVSFNEDGSANFPEDFAAYIWRFENEVLSEL